ncbi:MAG TPA: prepilin-type N-terminal cleavage/methylation domain-containing protein [Lacunisphaera sp.]|nr:prepilin-type N-terminal cleavage/methylation domain-containing protein [Lacunisphaera sp.]
MAALIAETVLPQPATRSGFTLVEVMMAMAIVVTGVVGMMQAVTIGTEMMDTASKQQVATRLVEAELERLRHGAWTIITTLPASATVNISQTGAISGDTTSFALSNRTASPADDNTALSVLARGFRVSLTTTRLRPTGATASTVTFIKVTYTVRWTSAAGRSHRRDTDAYLGANGLHLSYQQS